MPITSNQVVGQATVLSSATETITLSQFQLPAETLTGLRIKRIFFSGNVAISNGSANLINVTGTDHWQFDSSGAGIPIVNKLVFTLSTGATCVTVVDKIGTINANAAANVSYMVNP